MAFGKAGKCLSDNYINANTKYFWECEYNHQWMAKYNAVFQDHWCPECTKCKKKTMSMSGIEPETSAV